MERYSVLMSVYYREKAENLHDSMMSIFEQTTPTDDFVLICDGPLTRELDAVIDEMKNRYGTILHVVRLPKNDGLGNALNLGLQYCKNELVARMDSDDVSFSDRCERQLKAFAESPEISVLSGAVLEFRDRVDNVIGIRSLPENEAEISRFSRKRCPFNHPAVMFRKQAVEAAGGYTRTYPFFEDYDLWIRMLQNGSVGANLQEPLLYMRVSDDMYYRRGGKEYAKDMLRFRKQLLREGYIDCCEYCFTAFPHALICLLPNELRKRVYCWLHDSKMKDGIGEGKFGVRAI